MPTTKRPQGLLPNRQAGSGPAPGGMTTYRVGASAPSAIAFNDPVAMVNAAIQPATATTDYPLGVACGFQWVDPTTKLPTWSKSLPAGTSSYDSNIWVQVADGPNNTYIVVADATVSYGDIGFNYPLSGVGVPDTNGRSTAVLKVASRTSGTGAQYRVIGPVQYADNLFGSDAYPYVEVKIITHRDSRVSIA